MQEKMFEEARNDMNKMQENNMFEAGYVNNEQNHEEEDEEKNNNIELEEEKDKNLEEDDKEKDKNKEKYSNLDKQLFINNGGEDDINFD